MKKEIICTVCPRGCHIEVEGEEDRVVSVTGYTCKRGMEYASAEFIHPVRILTSTVKLVGAEDELLPVRSNKPVPKELILKIMELIRGAEVKKPVAMHQVLIPDVCGTGADIVATKAVN